MENSSNGEKNLDDLEKVWQAHFAMRLWVVHNVLGRFHSKYGVVFGEN